MVETTTVYKTMNKKDVVKLYEKYVVGSYTKDDFVFVKGKKASLYAEEKGIIIADTKFEFGYSGNEIILIDEVFTPDSSRFWEKSKYKIGQIQESLDKQYIRDYLESLNWDKNPPVPSLPDDVVGNTIKKYNQIYHILTGK